MIQNILELLTLARAENIKGEYVDIALGKNKLPNSIKEASIQLIREKR